MTQRRVLLFGTSVLLAFALLSCGKATEVVVSSIQDPYATPVYDSANPPAIQNRVHPSITKGGLEFNDASGDGSLQPYEDWRLSPNERAADLISRMSLEQKVGLLSQPGYAGVSDDGSLSEYSDDYAAITERHLRYGLVRLSTKPIVTATYNNNLQELTQSLEWGIPFIVSADPIHTVGTSNTSSNISLWPSQLGLGAVNDPELTRHFAEVTAEEYRALGIRMALHPMADTATDPRWDRFSGTFGSNFWLNAIHTVEYVKGLQGGDRLLPGGVIATVKHFAGYGAGRKGYDGHYQLGSTALFPGDNFESHLIPFEAAFTQANAAAVMPMYPIPSGITDAQVAGGFNKELMDLGRDLGFTGFYTSDWGVVAIALGPVSLDMGWGARALNGVQRSALSLNSGMNAVGGADIYDYVLEALAEGMVSEEVVSDSAERVLRAMFAMGLFEDPYAEIPEIDDLFTSASSEHWQEGIEAQRRAMVLLKNEDEALPASAGVNFYFDGFEDGRTENGAALVAEYGAEVVTDVASADVAVIRISQPRFDAYAFGSNGNGFFAPSSRSLQFIDEEADSFYGVEGQRFTDRYGNTYENAQLAANYDQLQKIYDARDAIRAAGSDTKLVVVINMNKPVVLKEFIDEVDALIVDFGAVDRAVLDIVFAKDGANFEAKLPFQISRSDANVELTLEDLSDDDPAPLFDSGFGLKY